MITTMIVDDNKVICEYFQTVVKWEKMGFELVSIANNGIEGWNEFNKRKPQLVITDVHMPGMTGLELAQKIRVTVPETAIVFISNFEDFDYLKGAMEIGAIDYILKHEARGQMLDQRLEKIKQYFYNRNCFRNSALLSAIYSVKTTDLQIVFPDRYSLVMLELPSVLPPFSRFSSGQTDENADSVLKELYEQYEGAMVSGIRIQDNRYIALIRSDSNFRIGNLNPGVSPLLNDTVLYFLVICENMPILDCLSAYAEHRRLLDRRFFYRHGFVMRADGFPLRVSSRVPPNFAELRQAVDKGDSKAALRILDKAEQAIEEAEDYDGLCCFVGKFLDMLEEYGERLRATGFSLYSESDVSFWSTSGEIFYWAKNKIIQLTDCLGIDPSLSYSKQVNDAIRYMRVNYAKNDLSINDIAGHVGVSVNQLNKLMKKETSLTAVKWLTNIRIDRAKELLAQNKKSSQIYSEVGYANISYFSNVFKSVCGVTPAEYRRDIVEK